MPIPIRIGPTSSPPAFIFRTLRTPDAASVLANTRTFAGPEKREFGIVTWDPSRCIGCRYCQVACAYNVPKFKWDTNNPKIVKCELCSHLVKDEATMTAGFTRYPKGQGPACCEVCPRAAVIFGKYTDLMADAKQRIAARPDRYWGPDGEPKIFGVTDGGGTQVLYLSHVPFEDLGLPALDDEPVPKLSRELQHGIYKGFIAPVAFLMGVPFPVGIRAAGGADANLVPWAWASVHMWRRVVFARSR